MFDKVLSEQELVACDCVKTVIENVRGIHRLNGPYILKKCLPLFHRINVRM